MRVYRRLGTLFLSGITALGAGTVMAVDQVATLARVDGTAIVSQGAGYVQGSEGMPLRDGDRLMVLDGGGAVVDFKDGCRYDVRDQELLSLTTVSTCASGTGGSYRIESGSGIANAQVQPLHQAALEVGVGSAAGGLSMASVPLVAAAGIGALAVVDANTNAFESSNNPPPPISQ